MKKAVLGVSGAFLALGMAVPVALAAGHPSWQGSQTAPHQTVAGQSQASQTARAQVQTQSQATTRQTQTQTQNTQAPTNQAPGQNPWQTQLQTQLGTQTQGPGHGNFQPPQLPPVPQLSQLLQQPQQSHGKSNTGKNDHAATSKQHGPTIGQAHQQFAKALSGFNKEAGKLNGNHAAASLLAKAKQEVSQIESLLHHVPANNASAVTTATSLLNVITKDLQAELGGTSTSATSTATSGTSASETSASSTTTAGTTNGTSSSTDSSTTTSSTDTSTQTGTTTDSGTSSSTSSSTDTSTASTSGQTA